MPSQSSKSTATKKSTRKSAKKKPRFTRCKTVNIDPEGASGLRVDVDRVRVMPPGRVGARQVKWLIADDAVPAGGRIAIEFTEQLGTRGPFGPGSANRYGRGRYFLPKTASMKIFSGVTDVYSNPRSTGEWRYSIFVYDKNGVEVRKLDPGVAIAEDEMT